MWSRRVGVDRTCHMTFVYVLELLPAPQNCIQRQKDITFKKLFTVVAVPLFLPRWPVQLQSESGVPVF